MLSGVDDPKNWQYTSLYTSQREGVEEEIVRPEGKTIEPKLTTKPKSPTEG